MKIRTGFTLVEAAVAIGVVAILAGILIPLVLKNLRDARNARARNDIQVIAAAIASQLKDTGRRPTADGGPTVGGASGAGDAMWFSGGSMPLENGVQLDAAGAYDQFNFFENLFSVPGHAGNPLFGLGAAPAGAEFQVKGPYLSRDIARKADPWGRAYLIYGYNGQGQRTGGPIWVVSAGAAGTLNRVNTDTGGLPPGNLAPAGTPVGQHVPVWDYTAPGAATNIAVRVN